MAIGMGAIMGSAFSALDYTLEALITDPTFETHDFFGLLKAIIKGWTQGALMGVGFWVLGSFAGLGFASLAMLSLFLGLLSGSAYIVDGIIDIVYGDYRQGVYKITIGAIVVLMSILSYCGSSRALGQSGTKYNGKLYRNVESPYDPLAIDSHNIMSDYRYTEPGQGGVYFGQTENVVAAECSNYGIDVNSMSRRTYEFDANYDNLLDLTSPEVRHNLGVTYRSITHPNDYTITHLLGRYADGLGYDGLIVPSARSSDGVNIVLFNLGGLS